MMLLFFLQLLLTLHVLERFMMRLPSATTTTGGGGVPMSPPSTLEAIV